jgi:hypothetical protein
LNGASLLGDCGRPGPNPVIEVESHEFEQSIFVSPA